MAVLQFALLTAAFAAAPQVELSTLAGEEHRGELVRIDESALTLKQGEESVELPLADLLGVRFTGEAPPKSADRKLARVALRDGSHFPTSTVTASGRQAAFAGGPLGEFQVPRGEVLSLRFDSDRSVDEAWQKLLDRQRKRDLLVIKKKGDVVVLDFLEGIVAAVTEKDVRFLLDGDEIPVPIDRVFGVIYADRETEAGKPLCEIVLHGSARLLAGQLHWDGGQARATLAAGGEVGIPAAAICELDFSLGKIRYLSQMEPRDVRYTPFFDVEFKYQRDRNLDGDPLRLGEETYARGLCIHSKTSLVYRINTDYRRLKAVVGIDRAVARRGLGDVRLVISDRDKNKVLFEAVIRGTDDPRPIDLDVSEVRELEILVDFGGDLDIADWLDLADARVLK